jgi:large subunit ribosomal protein L40e
VKTLRGGKTVTLDVGLNTTVRTIKEELEEKEKVPADQQRLIFAGKQLDDDTSVQSCGILKGSTIHLLLRLRGGMGTTSSVPLEETKEIGVPTSLTTNVSFLSL